MATTQQTHEGDQSSRRSRTRWTGSRSARGSSAASSTSSSGRCPATSTGSRRSARRPSPHSSCRRGPERSSRCTTSRDPKAAYPSIQHITNDLWAGWLVRGMHRWGASVFIILMFMHMGRVFLFGAYKYPRELNWIIGVLLLAMGLGRGLHGLPAAVGPDGVLGDDRRHQHQRRPRRSSGRSWRSSCKAERRSAPTRSRASMRSTCCLIPGAIFALIGVAHVSRRAPRRHVAAVVEGSGGHGPDRESARERRRRSGPDARYNAERPQTDAERTHRRASPRLPAVQGGRQRAREAVLPVRHVARHDHVVRRHRGHHRPRRSSGSTRRPAITTSARSRAGSGSSTTIRPTPARSTSSRGPDWYFYFLFYLLRIFKWPDSVLLGTIGIPTIALVLLLAMPFIDLRPERRPLAPAGGDRRRRFSSSSRWACSRRRVRPRRSRSARSCARRCRSGRRSRASRTTRPRSRARSSSRSRLSQLPHVPRRRRAEPRRARS